MTPGIHFSSIWAKHVLGPGHFFSVYFPTPFPDVILNVFFMLCSTVLLQMKVDIFPTPCVTSSLSYFWYRADDLFMLFPFGRPYGTGGISACSPLYCGVKPHPPHRHRLEFPPAPFSITFSNTLPRHRF